MAGTIVVNEKAWWSAAGAVHDYVVGRIFRHLKHSQRTALQERLSLASTEKTGYLNLEDLTEHEFRIFANAMIEAFKEMEREGPSSFRDSSFFPAYQARFAELIDLVKADLRYEPTKV